MPRPIFDIEQYELRGTLPEIYTEEQKQKLNSTLARVNGQIDWDAQLLGFSGPNYWGTGIRHNDGSYEWKGLPDTVNQKRRMQVGAFGVYSKDLDYSQWPAPFNREQVGASADASFHIFEVDGHTKVSPLNQGEGIDYMHDPLVFNSGYYIFDSEIEIEGRELDVDQFIDLEVFFDYGRTYTRLRVLDDAVGGTLLVRVKDSEAEPVPFKLVRWEDISDWSATAIRRQFIGMWGNKGNQLSVDFAVDALDLHGNDERFSLDYDQNTLSITPAEILDRVGLKPTFWTNVDNFAYKFSSEGCADAIALPPYLNGPLRGFNWRPNYIDDKVKFFDCTENCDYTLEITQVMSEVDYYDNGDYKSFCNSIPHDGFTDCQDIISQSAESIDNGIFYDELGDDPYPVGRIDEGEYDRNPWREIERFDIKFTPKTDYGLLARPCLTWEYDPILNNGTFEDYVPDPLAIQPDNEGGGPWATADNGEFDNPDTDYCIPHATQNGEPCEPDEWCGYDDGEYGMLLVDYPCRNYYYLESCQADGGEYSLYYGAPESLADCSWECPPIDNEPFETGFVFRGPPTADGGVLINIYDYDYPEISPPLDPEYVPTIEVCEIGYVHVDISDLFGEMTYKLQPNVRNSLVPLRTWKEHPLIDKDEVDTAKQEYWNYFEADTNRGPDQNSNYRHFLRLPIDYERDGREWNKAIAVSNNQDYFSAPKALQQTRHTPEQPRPLLYSEVYRDAIDEDVVMYEEDYLVSSIYDDTETVQPGFEDCSISNDLSDFIPFDVAVTLDYDPFEQRIPFANGEWRGDYVARSYKVGFTGHLSTDLKNYTLMTVDSPVYDESMIKRPNISFPESEEVAATKNWVVSYAYFASDFSAADDPIFDPDKAHCWRQREIASAVLDPEEENELDACIASTVSSNTAYLLHPTA